MLDPTFPPCLRSAQCAVPGDRDSFNMSFHARRESCVNLLLPFPPSPSLRHHHAVPYLPADSAESCAVACSVCLFVSCLCIFLLSLSVGLVWSGPAVSFSFVLSVVILLSFLFVSLVFFISSAIPESSLPHRSSRAESIHTARTTAQKKPRSALSRPGTAKRASTRILDVTHAHRRSFTHARARRRNLLDHQFYFYASLA